MAQHHIFYGLIATLIAVLVYMFTQVDKWIDTQDENKKLRAEVENLTIQLDNIEFGVYVAKNRKQFLDEKFADGWGQALDDVLYNIQNERGKQGGQDCC